MTDRAALGVGMRNFVERAFVVLSLVLASTADAGELVGSMVVSDAWPEPKDLVTWANDVLRIEGKTNASDRDKAVALYYWTRLFVMSATAGTEAAEGPYGAEQTIPKDVTRVMFVHGAGHCDIQSRALEAVWCLYKGDDLAGRRITLMPRQHTMVELAWNGTWHGFDPLNGVFILESDSPTANVLSFAEEARADALVQANQSFVHRSRPFFERVKPWDDPIGEWRMHLTLAHSYEDQAAWEAAGEPDYATFGAHSRPSRYPMSDMSWHLPRGARVERRWEAGPNFYKPQAFAARFGRQGRHYRQAAEWDSSRSNWNASEDLYNFPRVQPYLAVSSDPDDASFFGKHTLYLTSSGRIDYEADLWSDAYLDAVEGTSGLVRADTPPYLRPDAAGGPRGITFRVRSPYVIADAELRAAVAVGEADAARWLLSTDGGASWEEVASGGGELSVNLGKSRFNATQQSATGKYDYLVRFECRAASDPAAVGLSRLRLVTQIDGSLNALPRISAGTNTVRFKVQDASAVAAPIRVEYRWQAGGAEATHARTLQARDFTGNEAAYPLEAPGLTRCNAYAFGYGENDADGRGLPDTWERLYFPEIGGDPAEDADADGRTNAEEFAAGTAPAPLLPARPAEQEASPGSPPAPRASGNGSRSGCGCASGGASGAVLLLGWALRAHSRRRIRA